MTQRRWLGIARWVAGLGIVGLAIVLSGVVPIEASSGHWKVTAWMLELTKRRSVAVRAWGAQTLVLDEPWLVLKGAGHYETGCRPCHGLPETGVPRAARAMTPPPVPLGSRISTWKPEELFHIVKHGIKLTGMPAWVAQERDDEVRAMVAFLLVLPELDEAEYERLVHGEHRPGMPADLVATCARCHGVDGTGRELPAFPKLAGQRPEYLLSALQAFASGERHSGIMQPIAEALRPDQMRLLARHYGGLPAPVSASTRESDLDATRRGREIAERGIPTRRVPSCSDCHDAGGPRRNPAYPLLAGQHAEYVALQLELFHADRRGGSKYADLMDAATHRLTADEMRDVALYYASRREN